MKKFKLYFSALIFTVLIAGAAVADTADKTTTTDTNITETSTKTQDPIVMLQQVSNDVLHALQQNKNPTDLHSVYSVAYKYILPYVDFNEMSEWIAGRTVWNKASAETRKEFIEQFKILVVRTYATALNSYTNEKVEFSKQNLDLNKPRIQISSVIVRQGKENIHLDYRLVKKDNKWFVYDVIIEGVSILQGFQAQFSDEIRQQGLQTVIAQIKKHNQEKNA